MLTDIISVPRALSGAAFRRSAQPVIVVAPGNAYADQASVIANPFYDPAGTGIAPYRFLAYVRMGGSDAATAIGLAVSNDAARWEWTEDGQPGTDARPVIAPAAGQRLNSPNALWVEREGQGTLYLWSSLLPQSGQGLRIVLSTSSDGVHFSPAEEVLAPSGTGFDAYSVQAPSVLYNPDSALFSMWYVGRDGSSGTFGIGFAESHDGRSWRRNLNPVLESTQPWSDGGLGFPRVVRDGERYVMFYSGRALAAADGQAAPWHIGLASSLDGTAWTPSTANPVLSPGAAGSFDAGGVYSPSVLQRPIAPGFFLYYGGQQSGTGPFQTGLVSRVFPG
jgi:hypothetical protein